MLETPVWLTSTMQLGRVYDAACELELARHPEVADDVCIPVVAECDDSFLNDCRPDVGDRGRRARPRTTRRWPRAGSAAPPAEGAVGSGTGMSCLGFKGGIGTSSRVTPGGHTVAVLLMTNFGSARPAHRRRRPGRSAAAGATRTRETAGRLLHRRRRHRRAGRPDRLRAAGPPDRARPGPHRLDRPPRQRRDLPGREHDRAHRPRRAATSDDGRRLGGRGLDDLFEAVVDAAEESVLNSLLMSPTTVGRGRQHLRGARPRHRRTAAGGSTAVAGAERSVRIPMADGVELAATLFLPDTAEPQPCLLEALPYRKDDLTSSYAEGYRSLRDEHSYAVCRVDLRGTGSSAGDATDEYPLVERTDLCTVIAWLAEQEWCDGNVGMFGTSYSGFNSLQIAAERPPALKAIVRDLLQRRPVDRRRALARPRAAAGRPRRLLPLHDADVRAAAGAGRVAGGDWRDGVAAALGDQRAVAADLAAGEPGRALLAGRVAARRRCGYDRIQAADDDRGRLGGRLPQQHASAPSRRWARPVRRGGCWPGPGRTPTRPPPSPGRGSTSTARWSPGGTGGCAGPRPTSGPTEPTSSSAPPPSPSPTSSCTRATGSAGRGRPRTPGSRRTSSTGRARSRSSRTPASRPGSTAPATCRGACPATSATTTRAR